MSLGGNPADLRATAGRVRAWADNVEDDADHALGAAAVEWVSVAADAWRVELDDRVRDARAVAESMRDAARAIDSLADALEARQVAITRLLDQAGKTLDDIRIAIAEGAGDALDVAQGWADGAWEAGKDVVRKVGGLL